MVSGKKQKKEG